MNLTIWEICLYSAILLVALTVAVLFCLFLFGHKKSRKVNKLRILFTVFFICALLLGYPPIEQQYMSYGLGGVKTAIITFMRAVEIFGIDDLYEVVLDTLEYAPEGIRGLYLNAVMALQFAAPLLTFGFILSFFKNLVAIARYRCAFLRRTHIFSELNEKTLALAGNIVKKWEESKNLLPPLIVFTDVAEGAEKISEMKAEALSLGAIMFKKGLEAINFAQFILPRKISFYLISRDENEKIRHATHIMKKYDTENVSLHIFSDDVRSDLMVSSKDTEKMKVIRVNDTQSLIYHNLDMHGHRLFKNAKDHNNGEISAIVIGFGRYGFESLKALCWYCQMPGYSVKINLFDKASDTEKRLCGMCPELMEKSGQRKGSDAVCDVTVHSGVDVFTADFAKALESIPDATYVFISLGEDDLNISAATRVRNLYKAINKDYEPDIETVVYESSVSRAMSCVWGENGNSLGGAKNFRDQGYNIHMIGDLESFYTVDTVIDSGLDRSGLEIHLGYCGHLPYDEAVRSFWQFEYNYRSSLAKAIHDKVRRRLTEEGEGYVDLVPEANAVWEERPFEDKVKIASVEHIRWNAYMRAEGYSYGEQKDFLAKTHPDLKPTEELTEKGLKNNADEVIAVVKDLI